MMAVLARITDASRFFEFKTMFGGNLVCGFGHLCGFLANAGPVTAADAQKGGHFVQLCDNRDIPLVFLQNSSLSQDAAWERELFCRNTRGMSLLSHSCTKWPPFCASAAVTGPALARKPVSWPQRWPNPHTRLPPNIVLNSKNLLASVILASTAIMLDLSMTGRPPMTSRP